jgi:hypothetical protein
MILTCAGECDLLHTHSAEQTFMVVWVTTQI